MDYEKLLNDMGNLDEDAVLETVNAVAAQNGEGAQQTLEAMQKGMEVVGTRFEEGEYFIGDLMYAGEIMAGAMEILKPVLSGGDESNGCGKMILATVKDDLHDIGKNIVKSILEAAGFDVIDLGIDVPAETIVETAKKENVKIIALSGVLTLALDSMKRTIDSIKEAGLEDVKVIIGGNPVNEYVADNIGADAWAHSPQKGATICKEWAMA